MKHPNWILGGLAIALTVLPLWLVSDAPAGASPAAGLFGGADERGLSAIAAIAPGYRPWFAPVLEPAGAEVASLLFALQAAIGAGVLGFWLGLSVARERARRAATVAAADKERHED